MGRIGRRQQVVALVAIVAVLLGTAWLRLTPADAAARGDVTVVARGSIQDIQLQKTCPVSVQAGGRLDSSGHLARTPQYARCGGAIYLLEVEALNRGDGTVDTVIHMMMNYDTCALSKPCTTQAWTAFGDRNSYINVRAGASKAVPRYQPQSIVAYADLRATVSYR